MEVDKIYLSTPTKIAILDHEKKRTFVIRKDGLPDAGKIPSAHLLSNNIIIAYIFGAISWYLYNLNRLMYINPYNFGL